MIDPRTIEQGSLKALVHIEPMWTSPRPTCQHPRPHRTRFHHKPKQWYIMGQTVHDDRLLTLVSRPVPDMLKPAYNFGGVSMSQLMQPYVNRWLRTVNSVSDLVNGFHYRASKRPDILSGGCDDVNLQARADLYNQYATIAAVCVDKEEEFSIQRLVHAGHAARASARANGSPTTPLVNSPGVRQAV